MKPLSRGDRRWTESTLFFGSSCIVPDSLWKLDELALSTHLPRQQGLSKRQWTDPHDDRSATMEVLLKKGIALLCMWQCVHLSFISRALNVAVTTLLGTHFSWSLRVTSALPPCGSHGDMNRRSIGDCYCYAPFERKYKISSHIAPLALKHFLGTSMQHS